MRTLFEVVYSSIRWLDHPLYQHVFRIARELEHDRPLRVLDVGGRRSNYTIGLRSRATLTDIPPAGELQSRLDLGATEAVRKQVLGRRSNVNDYLLDDMTETRLDAQSFDLIIAVEVLEHVTEDEAFVRNVARVLKPGGTFLMTTPNGDHLPIPYPDHKRHYRRDQLAALLSRHFSSVRVDYAVNDDALIRFGVHRVSWQTPFRSLALGLSYRLERLGNMESGPAGKRHLLAVAR